MKCHILNGDALKDQFPESITGQVIVARECTVDGDVQGEHLEDFYASRISFLRDAYGIREDEYRDETITEFNKILDIPAGSEINLWFEDDLFCQCNLWFVADLIHKRAAGDEVYLIRPDVDIRLGFGGMGKRGLEKAFERRKKIAAGGVETLSMLWKLYQRNDTNEMMVLARKNSTRFPFLENAVQAQIDRFPPDGSPGRPERTLAEIMKTFGDSDFGRVYREFHRQEGIYGFGDWQVRRMFDIIKKGNI